MSSKKKYGQGIIHIEHLYDGIETAGKLINQRTPKDRKQVSKYIETLQKRIIAFGDIHGEALGIRMLQDLKITLDKNVNPDGI